MKRGARRIEGRELVELKQVHDPDDEQLGQLDEPQDHDFRRGSRMQRGCRGRGWFFWFEGRALAF